MTDTTAMSTEITYDDLKSVLPDIILIDARGKEEIRNDGQIEGSHNIPVGEVETALDLSDEDFLDQYGFPKPSLDAPIVTHCKIGGRAQRTADTFVNKGYTNVRCYKGSLTDWIANGGDLIKPGQPYEKPTE